MTGVTRADLYATVRKKFGLSLSRSQALVENGIRRDRRRPGQGRDRQALIFIARKKKQRIGRNPKTGTVAPISSRRVVVFKPSAILKQQMNGKRSVTKKPVAELASSALAR